MLSTRHDSPPGWSRSSFTDRALSSDDSYGPDRRRGVENIAIRLLCNIQVRKLVITSSFASVSKPAAESMAWRCCSFPRHTNTSMERQRQHQHVIPTNASTDIPLDVAGITDLSFSAPHRRRANQNDQQGYISSANSSLNGSRDICYNREGTPLDLLACSLALIFPRPHDSQRTGTSYCCPTAGLCGGKPGGRVGPLHAFWAGCGYQEQSFRWLAGLAKSPTLANPALVCPSTVSVTAGKGWVESAMTTPGHCSCLHLHPARCVGLPGRA